MQTIKSIVVKNMRAITLVMVVIILLLSTVIQTFGIHQTNQENAMRIFSQVEHPGGKRKGAGTGAGRV